MQIHDTRKLTYPCYLVAARAGMPSGRWYTTKAEATKDFASSQGRARMFYCTKQTTTILKEK